MLNRTSAIAFLLLLSGCATSATDKWFQAAVAVETVQGSVISLAQAGKLKGNDLERASQALAAAEIALLRYAKDLNNTSHLKLLFASLETAKQIYIEVWSEQ